MSFPTRLVVADGLAVRCTKVVPAAAHLNHDPTHNPWRSPTGLRAYRGRLGHIRV